MDSQNFKSMNDELGQRIKDQYENRTRYFVPRRTYMIIRLDGKAFHTYTRGLSKPFDKELYEDMDEAIIAMMPEIQGAVFAYTQSDEISVLVTDFATPTTSAWFDGNIQKIASVSSSIITAEFNRLRWFRELEMETMAFFDSRIFTIPDRTEVMNYFIWRNQDCARNSVSMVAQSNFSHKELHGVSTAEMQEMLMTRKEINWSEYDEALKNGRLIVKEEYAAPVMYHGTLQQNNAATYNAMRTKWVVKPAWKFTQDKEKLLKMIPQYA
jgi:tRNA(His) 5'-end guanylyltransferase